MAYMHDDENLNLWQKFANLNPFERLKVTAKTQKFPKDDFHLDEPLRVSIDRNEAKLLYSFVLSLWPRREMDKLSKVLDQVTIENISDKEFQKNLRVTRGWLKRLRSAAVVLSSDNMPSKDLDRLIVVMGKIKDHVDYHREAEAVTYLPEFKELLSKASRESIAGEISNFRPGSKKQFEEWLNGQMSNLKSRLKEKNIKPRPFHDLRKFIDHLTALFAAFYALDPNPETHNYYCFLVSLNARMGALNDKLEGSQTHSRFEIPDEMRNGLNELLKNLIR
jgi:hypothetical protein